jgi:hypothetical protein
MTTSGACLPVFGTSSAAKTLLSTVLFPEVRRKAHLTFALLHCGNRDCRIAGDASQLANSTVYPSNPSVTTRLHVLPACPSWHVA